MAFSDSASDNAVTGYAFPLHVVVRNNGLAGIHVNGGSTVRNLLATGCIYNNGGPGIALSGGGNNSKAAPIITEASTTSIKGTAAPSNMIFLYSDPGDEGQDYFATVYTDALGKFSWTGTAKGPHITAIAVDTSAGLTVNNTSGFSTPRILTGIKDNGESDQPMQFELSQNYPNPFNPVTTIGFRVPGGGFRGAESSTLNPQPATLLVRLAVYDLLGREVAVLVNERRAPGEYSVTFDGSHLASGCYVYRLTAGDNVASKSLLLLK
jgi:Secretion system C-terminal sorting domain